VAVGAVDVLRAGLASGRLHGGERGLGTEARGDLELLADALQPGIEAAVHVAWGPHDSYLRAPMNMPLSAS
jgi:hypothetical protein